MFFKFITVKVYMKKLLLICFIAFVSMSQTAETSALREQSTAVDTLDDFATALDEYRSSVKLSKDHTTRRENLLFARDHLTLVLAHPTIPHDYKVLCKESYKGEACPFDLKPAVNLNDTFDLFEVVLETSSTTEDRA